MSDREVELGDEVKIKIIGVFYRGDGDHKFIAVEEDSVVNDLFELTEEKLDSLYKLYPSVGENEGWRGRASALYALENEDKAL